MKQVTPVDKLITTALRLGAGKAALIPSSAIVVEEHLAGLCSGDPGCPQYGAAAGCPPHVGGPAAFKVWQAASEYALVVRMEVPVAAMFCDDRLEIMRQLHHLVAGIEQEAETLGFPGARAFAGGSCKQLFCDGQTNCRVVAEAGACRHPSSARPSMSGFGINVSALMRTCGWTAQFADRAQAADPAAMTWVCGLILIF